MSHLADVYIIKKSRSKLLGENFISHFLPLKKESATVYEIPRFGKEVEVEFNCITNLMRYLEINSEIEYSIYWSNLDEKNLNRHGMIFYTSDAHMIFGISIISKGSKDTNDEENCLKKLKNFLKTDEGYITYECPPESSYLEFMRAVKDFEERKSS